MSWDERALVIPGGPVPLAAVLALPQQAPVRPKAGVVVVVGGPQYRAGSHRQFVLLARHLAAAGHPVLRFDYRGMGDSVAVDAQGGVTPLPHFERAEEDVGLAVAALRQAVPGLPGVVLWGLCDGASAALLYLQRQLNPAVHGLVLLNPWVRTEQGEARARVKHYYLQRLMDRGFWLKLAKGGVGLGALGGLLGNLRRARGAAGKGEAQAQEAYPRRMAQAWAGFTGPGLLLLSEHDFTAREFEDFAARDTLWAAALAQRPLPRKALAGADHTCSQRSAEQQVHELTLAFLGLPALAEPVT